MNHRPNRKESETALVRREAAEAWRRRDFARFFNQMRKAVRLAPRDAGILLDLGAGHGMRTEFAEAEQCFERAVTLAANKTETLAMIGLHCRNFLRYDLAEHYLERAGRESSASPDTLAKLAEMHERLRRNAEAETAVSRALAKDPECQLALLVRARLLRSARQLEDAEQILRSFLSRTDPDGWSTRIRGWYELGAVLDRQERYDEAMTALLAAKKMILPHAAPAMTTQKAVQQRLREAGAGLSRDLLEKWTSADAAPSGRRLALIAGHPRSGTTLLEQLLDAHHGIVSAEETAIFFETYLDLRRHHPAEAGMIEILDSQTPSSVAHARTEYLRLMDRFVGVSAADRLLIDKNPSLTALIPAILRVLPQTQIIVALRDPRDVCLSCFMQPLPINPASSSYLTLEGTVQEYCSLMGFWQAIKPLLPSPALEVRYEDVVDNVQGEAERTLRFLGFDWDPAVLKFAEKARKKLVRSPTYAEVARPISRGAIGRWRHYRKHLEPYLAMLAPFVEAFGYEPD